MFNLPLTLVPLSHHEVSLSKGELSIPLWFDRRSAELTPKAHLPAAPPELWQAGHERLLNDLKSGYLRRGKN